MIKRLIFATIFCASFYSAYLLFMCATPNIKPGIVIILNGPSASGKSSIQRAFQEEQPDLWLGMGIDATFVALTPKKYFKGGIDKNLPRSEFFMRGTPTEDGQGPLYPVEIGEKADRVMKGMHRAIAAYARAGSNVIVDYIMYEKEWLADLHEALKGLKVYMIGVKMPLDVLVQREKTRNTSPQGHARSHYQKVHEGVTYALEISDPHESPEAIAQRISTLITHQPVQQ